MGNDWRVELGTIIDKQAKMTRAELESARFAQFLDGVIAPAFQELSAEFGKHGRKATIRQTPNAATLSVANGETEEIFYRILARSLPVGIVPYAEVRMRKGQRLVKKEEGVKGVSSTATIDQIRAADIIASFLSYYRAALDSSQT